LAEVVEVKEEEKVIKIIDKIISRPGIEKGK